MSTAFNPRDPHQTIAAGPKSSRRWSAIMKATSGLLFITATATGLVVGLGGPGAAPVVVPVAAVQTITAPVTTHPHRVGAQQHGHRGGSR